MFRGRVWCLGGAISCPGGGMSFASSVKSCRRKGVSARQEWRGAAPQRFRGSGLPRVCAPPAQRWSATGMSPLRAAARSLVDLRGKQGKADYWASGSAGRERRASPLNLNPVMERRDVTQRRRAAKALVKLAAHSTGESGPFDNVLFFAPLRLGVNFYRRF